MFKLDTQYVEKHKKRQLIWWLVIFSCLILWLISSLLILSATPRIGVQGSLIINIIVSIILFTFIYLIIYNPLISSYRMLGFVDTHHIQKTQPFIIIQIQPALVTLEKIAFYELDIMVLDTHEKVYVPSHISLLNIPLNTLLKGEFSGRYLMGVSNA